MKTDRTFKGYAMSCKVKTIEKKYHSRILYDF